MTLINFMSRRVIIAGAAASLFAPIGVFANSQSDAENLISNIVRDFLSTIHSNKSQTAMFKDFERIILKYTDTALLARKALGRSSWQGASAAQRKAYVLAFRNYLARFYGKRFQEFHGSEINVKKSKKVSGGYLVDSIVKKKGYAPFMMQWHVITKQERLIMYNLYIEGVSILSDIGVQIGSILDKQGGNIDKLIGQLKAIN